MCCGKVKEQELNGKLTATSTSHFGNINLFFEQQTICLIRIQVLRLISNSKVQVDSNGLAAWFL